MSKALLKNVSPGLTTEYVTPHTCGVCHSHIADDWAFCPECGTPTGLDGRPETRYQHIRAMTIQEMAGPYGGIVDMIGELCEDGVPGPDMVRDWLERPILTETEE